jgi:hypothetical protein
MTIKPKWNCPNCPMSSTRHWNVLRHINRWHAGLGLPVSNYARQYRSDVDPQSFASSGHFNNNRHHHYGVEGYSMKAESSTSNNSNPTNSQFVPEELDNDHTHQRNSLNESSPSSFSTASPKKEGSQNTFNKLLLEFNELLKIMPAGASSQQSVTMNDIMMGLYLRSLFTSMSNSNNNIFQKNDNSVMNNNNNNNNNNNKPPPAGYRIQFCNTCLPGNRLEPISAPFIIFEALTKIHHRCETDEGLESLSSTMEQQNAKYSSPYTIKQAQERLISYLREVFIIRVGQQQGGAEEVVDVTLKAHDYIPEPIIGEKLPQNRSWVRESDYIDLGNLSNIEQEKNWVYRLFKEGGKGTTKIIKINKNEFTDFVNIAKATFGAFKVQLDDDARSKRYFLILVEF